MQLQFKKELKEFNNRAKNFYSNNELTKQSIKFARQKINNALNDKGILDFKLLPKLLSNNPKLEKSGKYQAIIPVILLAIVPLYV